MSDDSSNSRAAGTLPRLQALVTHRGAWYATIALIGVGSVYFLAQIISGLLVYTYPLWKGWSHAQTNAWLDHSIFGQFFYILVAEILMVAALFALLKLFRWNLRTIGLVRPKLSHIGWGVLAVLLYLAVYMTLVSITSYFFPSLNVDQKQQIGFNSTKTTLELILTFISLVVLPPLVEEVMMRGFLYSGLRRAFPKVVSALLVSALFGLAHLAEGGSTGPLWIGALDTFALSLVLVFLREFTGNLWAGITLHAIKNGIAFVSLFILVAR